MSDLLFQAPNDITTSQDFNLMAGLLGDKRSKNTQRAYESDLVDFFRFAYNQEPTEGTIAYFLTLTKFNALAQVLNYKKDLLKRNLSESTINRRLSAIKSLVNFAVKLGRCEWNLNDVRGEKQKSYRDTTGISPDSYNLMLSIPDQNTIRGARDFAILKLLWSNAIRRNEASMCNISDFNPDARSLSILGKGRGTQKELISLSGNTILAIQNWLKMRENISAKQPLFIALDSINYGHRLSGRSFHRIVDSIAKQAGINKIMSPHRIRHSAITAALDATQGDVREVQKLSRHRSLETLMKYDDNRINKQGKISDLLDNMY